MKKTAMAVALIALVSGCISGPREAVVTSFNGDSVNILVEFIGYMTPEALEGSRANADLRAQEICERGPKKNAEFESRRNVSGGELITHESRFYLCLD